MCVSVARTQRIIILNQFLSEPVKFIFEGRILELFQTFDQCGITASSTIIGIPHSINKKITKDQIVDLIYEAQLVEERIRIRENLKKQTELQISKLKDLSIIQKLRKNQQIMMRFATFLQSEKNNTSNDLSIENHLICYQALEPSTQPLPVLW